MNEEEIEQGSLEHQPISPLSISAEIWSEYFSNKISSKELKKYFFVAEWNGIETEQTRVP